MRIRQIPGLSMRVAQHGKLLFQSELGVSDLVTGADLLSGHRFRLGCLTKPIVAHAVLQLARQGRLALDESVAVLIPELAARPEFQAFTVSHLLGHTSGLARGPYCVHGYSDAATLQRILASQLLFEPGRHFKYSNWGYYLLGKVIERISGDTAPALIAKAIFAPLGMQASGFPADEVRLRGTLATGYWKGWYFGAADLAEASEPCPHIPMLDTAGGVIATADDYLRWLISLLDTRDHGAAQMFSHHHQVRPGYSSCLGMFMEEAGGVPFYYFAASNSGYSGFMLAIPAQGLVGVALCNQAACNDELRDMLYLACRESMGGGGLPRFGRYDERCSILAGNRRGMVRFDGNVLLRDERHIRLHPYSRSAYFMLDGEDRRHMLRIRGRGQGDAVITLGSQVFYERLIRLRNRPGAQAAGRDFTGMYRHAAFGKVEIIRREDQLYLSYGAAYESLLQPVGQLRYKQGPGAFCFEDIAFQEDADSGDVTSFVLNDMVFLRA